MKKLITIIGLFAFSCAQLFAIETSKGKITFLPVPKVSYNSDTGFEYGAMLSFFFTPTDSQTFSHSLFIDYSRSTKNNQFIRMFYESTALIPNVRTMLDIAYMHDLRYDFSGFNGYEAVYDRALDLENRAFYSYRRNNVRVRADFQGQLPVKNLYWMAGYEYLHFGISTSRLSRGTGDDQSSLYEKYIDWGLIPAANAKGGDTHSFKAGVIYDSRDMRLLPNKGIFSEAILQVAPEFFFNKNTAYAEMALTHRQYIPLIYNRLTFAYRAAYQSTLGSAGKPFYAMPQMLGSYQTGVLMEGLGGNRSLRGVMRNRVTGDGFVIGNFELRYRVFDFKILKQNVNVIPHVFFDTGRVVKFSKINLDAVPEAEREHFFDPGAETFHSSAGAGLRLWFNKNFVLTGDVGKALSKKDGRMGIYIGANVLF